MALGGQSELVEVRAFRGGRKASVYREQLVPVSVFRRIVAAAGERRLPVLPSLTRGSRRKLDKSEALQLAREAGRIRQGAELLDLDGDLVRLAELASWCARAPGGSWMTVAL